MIQPAPVPASVMLVDDHPMFIEGIKSVLQAADRIEVAAAAHSGEQAMHLLRQQPTDLLITDIRMPGMSGITLAQKTKEEFPDTKVLVLTMYNGRELVKEILFTEAEGYILKNTRMEELLKAIDRIIDGGTHYCNEITSVMKEIINKKRTNSLSARELSPREREILQLVCQEYSNIEISDKLFISVTTVETHRKSIFRKTQAKTLVGLVRYAVENDLAFV